jgi:hypothetical protein
MQTALSFCAVLDLLVIELEQRRDLVLPVLLMVDQHNSRWKEEAADWFLSHTDKIIPWFERPKTSTWAQALDQIMKDYHMGSNKAKKRYIDFVARKKHISPLDIYLKDEVL